MVSSVLGLVTENIKLIYIITSIIVASVILIKNWENAPDKLIKAHLLVILWSAFIYWCTFIIGVINPEVGYYFDWIISTPILIYAITITSTRGEFTKNGVKAVILQVLVILTGYIATTEDNSLTWFAVGTIALIGVFFYVEKIEGIKEYGLLLIILIGTWIAYPLVWWMTGGELVEAKTALVLIPVVSKHVFALIDLAIYD